ncbi:MAG TPA: hypothetical protein VMM76_22475 [Pirellulaceae bacterium]|nr:hypothetical protein [Pirellulaceae bacterium]
MNELRRIDHIARVVALIALSYSAQAVAGVGDPQVATDHPWYPGELAYSTFERLAETQAALYEKVVGEKPTTDEQRVLAAWLWRNTHYWHGEQGVEDLWGRGFHNDSDSATREYWTGLFAHGFGLCGTTHAQWTAEMEHLLGHNRARVVGVTGHNSFEVFLTGGAYGAGRWALLDHDVSTVIFDDAGERLLSIAEIKENFRRWTKEQVAADKQHGWLVSGLHPDDGSAFDTYRSAEYLAGYAGPPPLVHLRRGESLRRYIGPGLDDGRTFVFWGRNYNSEGIPGPERSRTWVNQPTRMHGSKVGTGHHAGQARYANAVYTYRPDFTTGDYREGVIDESDQHVTFEFQSPYIIAATPANDEPWGIYQAGSRNGLVVTGEALVPVSLSTDRGRTWRNAGTLDTRIDLTDLAKGHRQYWLRLESGASCLAGTKLQITTVCQANSSVIPRLADNGSRVEFQASGLAIASAGPNIAQAETHRVAGAFDSPRVTLELAAPRGSAAAVVYAAAHVASSNPPSPEIAYRVDYSTDKGKSWQPLVSDWRITRQGQEPADFWSQSFCWGSTELSNIQQPVQVRFENNGGKRYRRAEVHLLYRVPEQDATRVTFHWQDDSGVRSASHVFASDDPSAAPVDWQLPTGKGVKTLWVEYEPVSG